MTAMEYIKVTFITIIHNENIKATVQLIVKLKLLVAKTVDDSNFGAIVAKYIQTKNLSWKLTNTKLFLVWATWYMKYS